jgi:hypothetical protein
MSHLTVSPEGLPSRMNCHWDVDKDGTVKRKWGQRVWEHRGPEHQQSPARVTLTSGLVTSWVFRDRSLFISFLLFY